MEDEEEELDLPYVAKEEEKKNDKKKVKEPKANIELEQALIEVTEENIHKFTFKDVVLPLVGHKTRFPANDELNKIMIDFMYKDGITLANFEALAN